MSWQMSVGVLAGTVSITTLVGLIVRFALVPYLQDHLIDPVIGEIRETKQEVLSIARMYDGHLEWSQKEVDRIWAQLNHRKGH